MPFNLSLLYMYVIFKVIYSTSTTILYTQNVIAFSAFLIFSHEKGYLYLFVGIGILFVI